MFSIKKTWSVVLKCKNSYEEKQREIEGERDRERKRESEIERGKRGRKMKRERKHDSFRVIALVSHFCLPVQSDHASDHPSV